MFSSLLLQSSSKAAADSRHRRLSHRSRCWHGLCAILDHASTRLRTARRSCRQGSVFGPSPLAPHPPPSTPFPPPPPPPPMLIFCSRSRRRPTRKPHPVASRATVQKAAASGCGACTYASRADSAGTARERVLVLLAVVGRQSRRHRRRLSPCHASRACRGFVAWLVLRAFSSTHIDDDSRVVLALRSSGARGVLPFFRRASRGGAASSAGD